jgi:H+/Cl- antiporter ClcA
MYTLLKAVATWFTTWSGVPAGIFAPSLAIGAGNGSDVAWLTGFAQRPALIALGKCAFLAAGTQAPQTTIIIVMEMVAGHAMVLSLMSCALVASLVARLISAPLYRSLTTMQLERLPGLPEGSAEPDGPADAGKKMGAR